MRVQSVSSLLVLFVVSACTSIANSDETIPTHASDSPDLWASVDFIFWKPHQRGLDFAATEDGTALVIGSGRLHDVEIDRDFGVRTKLGLIAANGWGLNIGYTYFESEGFNEVDRPAGTGQLFSSFSHPGGPEEADVARGEAGIDYNVFDVLARYQIICERYASVDLHGGLRFAKIDQQIIARFDGRDFTNGVVQHDSDLDAFGFQFGGTANVRANCGLSFFGSSTVAALYGNVNNRRQENNFDGAQVLVDLQDDYAQPIFNLETSLGVRWQRGDWTLAGGYEFNIWTNLGDRLRFVDDIEEASLTAIPGDLLLEGVFVRIAKTW